LRLVALVVKWLRENAKAESIMTPEQVEEKLIELIHREPFVPFVVEMTDGHSLEIPHPRLAINGGGAGFIGPDGGLVDFNFKTVRSIRLNNAQAAL
jgi:hypothetical protein